MRAEDSVEAELGVDMEVVAAAAAAAAAAAGEVREGTLGRWLSMERRGFVGRARAGAVEGCS